MAMCAIPMAKSSTSVLVGSAANRGDFFLPDAGADDIKPNIVIPEKTKTKIAFQTNGMKISECENCGIVGWISLSSTSPILPRRSDEVGVYFAKVREPSAPESNSPHITTSLHYCTVQQILEYLGEENICSF
jgi:hypothetical protein